MQAKDFIPQPYTVQTGLKTYQHKAPSNIALVKYWGKRPDQTPMNPSVSFTLTDCYTETSVEILPKTETHEPYQISFFFEGKPKPEFLPKMQNFFKKIDDFLPFLKQVHLRIHSSNSFPHSSGIASSASAMASLAVCFMQIEKDFSSAPLSEDYFYKKASFLARLGSGSASRSIGGSLVLWGESADFQGSSDLYGIPYPKAVHPVFQNYQDTILLIDKGQKKVSSTQGHQLMHGHIFAEQRFVQAHQNLLALAEAFKTGDLEKFTQITENEALTLHAMMMTSQPYFILMKPNTLSAIERIWAYRESTKNPVSFTLDAGANIHLLYPKSYKTEIQSFIQEELSVFCQNGQYIADEVC